MTASSPNPFNTGGGFVTVRGTFDMGAVEVTDASLTLTNGGRTGPLTLTRDFGLNVSNTLTVNGLLTWEGSQSTIGSAGMIPGPVPDVVANAGMVFSGRAGSINERLENVRLILNGGTSTMSGGGLVLGTRAALVNASGSTLVNAGWQFGTSSASFENAGVLRVSSSSIVSSTVSSSGVGQFVNAGTMEVTGRFNFPTVTGAPPNGMVNRGVLTVNSGGTVSGSVVNTGSGVLRGSGALEGGPFIFGPGTTLSPGVGVGVLSTTGPVSLSGGATFLAQLNGNTPGSGYDRLDLGGTGTIDLGGATLATSLGYQPSPADLVVLLLGSGSSPQVSGTFTNALLGSVIYVGTFDGVNYGARVNYTANSMFLDNFQVVAIPEPTSLALATLALVGGVAVRRRRKSESK
jgi:hypothetical protein